MEERAGRLSGCGADPEHRRLQLEPEPQRSYGGMDELPPALNRRIGRIAARFSGRFGFYAKDLRHREEVAFDGDSRYSAASTIKLFVLRELFRRADAGELDLLLDTIEMTAHDLVKGSGVLRDLTPGLRLKLGDLATLMITVSDNTAANPLIDHLATRAINRGMERAGYRDTHLRGPFFRSRAASGDLTRRPKTWEASWPASPAGARSQRRPLGRCSTSCTGSTMTTSSDAGFPTILRLRPAHAGGSRRRAVQSEAFATTWRTWSVRVAATWSR